MNFFEDKFGKYFKHKSLVRFFFIATVFSCSIFFIVTALTMSLTQVDRFNSVEKRLEHDQLESIQVNLRQYITNRIKVLKDIASFPIITNAVMNMNENDPSVIDFLSISKVFGEAGEKILLDVNKQVLFASERFDESQINQESLDLLLQGEQVARVLLNEERELEFYIPILYGNSVEGTLVYCESFNLKNIIGNIDDIAISITAANAVQLSSEEYENFADNAITTGLDEFDMVLRIAAKTNFERDILLKSLFGLFVSLFLGSIISAFLIFLYGKKYLIEPYKELEKTESKLELALEASQVGTWFWDVKTGEVVWDDYIFEVYGAKKSDFENSYESFEKFIVEDDREPLRKKIQESIENHLYLDTEFRIRKRDSGEIRHIGVKAHGLYDDNGVLESMTGVNYDVTGLKTLTQELQESNKALEEFAYFVSHDLQEPVRTISSYVELLLRHISSKFETDENTEKYTRYLKESSLRMRNMIKDILAYARIGNMGQITEVDLNEVLVEIEKDLAKNIEETKAEIIYDKLPTLQVRRFEMVQLFQNLVVNALKFRSEERDPKVKISFSKKDEFYEFKVRDNGKGISEEDFDKIFVVFERVNRDTKVDGSGIGLSICKKVIQGYDGEISINSKLGEWTEFTFTLKY